MALRPRRNCRDMAEDPPGTHKNSKISAKETRAPQSASKFHHDEECIMSTVTSGCQASVLHVAPPVR